MINESKTIYVQVSSKLGLDVKLRPSQESVLHLGHQMSLSASWSRGLQRLFICLVFALAAV